MYRDRPTKCAIISGVLNYANPHDNIECSVDSYYNRIYIKNFDRFDNNNAFIIQVWANNAFYAIPGAEKQRFMMWASS